MCVMRVYVSCVSMYHQETFTAHAGPLSLLAEVSHVTQHQRLPPPRRRQKI